MEQGELGSGERNEAADPVALGGSGVFMGWLPGGLASDGDDQPTGVLVAALILGAQIRRSLRPLARSQAAVRVGRLADRQVASELQLRELGAWENYIIAPGQVGMNLNLVNAIQARVGI